MIYFPRERVLIFYFYLLLIYFSTLCEKVGLYLLEFFFILFNVNKIKSIDTLGDRETNRKNLGGICGWSNRGIACVSLVKSLRGYAMRRTYDRRDSQSFGQLKTPIWKLFHFCAATFERVRQPHRVVPLSPCRFCRSLRVAHFNSTTLLPIDLTSKSPARRRAG